MSDDLKNAAITFAFIAVMLTILSIRQYHKDDLDAQEKIACYEASKTNTNIRCDK